VPRTTVFIVGAGRSGTTFLQNLLGAHPAIATTQETDLFSHYIRPWREQWERQLPESPDEWRRWRHKGLPAVLVEQEFDALLADVVERVHAATMALKPDARILLEKVPGYGLHGELILRLLPHARFIHLIRDGRDVACSMVRASRGWGRGWAPGTVDSAAEQWREHVVGTRSIAAETDGYVEARYEELCSPGGARLLSTLFDFCGVELPEPECAALIADGPSSLLWSGEVARRLGTPDEPEGFSGEGGIGAWRRELGARDRVAFERRAGTLLAELGYAEPGWAGGRVEQIRYRATQAVWR
jgi:hypothetical protein